MNSNRFENIRVVLAEPDARLRKDIQKTLNKAGFQDVQDVANLSSMVPLIEAGDVDLLIGDTKLPEGDLKDVVHRLRHGELGDNPFVVVVTLVSDPTPDLIKDVINSGADVVLVKPFDLDDLLERVLALAQGRKRFVVTTDYIGPDRRAKPRLGTMDIPQTVVPNPLRLRVAGQIDAARINRTIEAAAMEVNVQKVERHAYQIKFLADRILAGAGEGALDDQVRSDVERLECVAEDMGRRVAQTPYAHTREMCLTLCQTAKQLSRSPETCDPNSLDMLSKVAWAIFGPIDRKMGAAARREVATGLPVGASE